MRGVATDNGQVAMGADGNGGGLRGAEMLWVQTKFASYAKEQTLP